MPKSQAPVVRTKPWLDWSFDAKKEPFDKTTSDAEVKEMRKKIENYARTALVKGNPSWSIEFEWSIADKISLVYNLKATIAKKKTKAVGIAHARGIGTPQPPPQPPPPNL